MDNAESNTNSRHRCTTCEKSGGLLSEDSADSFEVHFDPNYSEYDLMAKRQYKETKYSQELKLATSPVSNVSMHYRYHMESYKTLINYAQTHPTENEYLKEVMKDSIAKMVRFTTESVMVDYAAVGDTKSNASTIKHRLPHFMGVPLRIVSSHQGTQKKKQGNATHTMHSCIHNLNNIIFTWDIVYL
jgi:hypothetical protein